MDYSTLQGLTIPEGVVTQIAKDGVILWSAVKLIEDRAVLTVAKKTATTYAGETKYTDESFILLDIYPLSGGTVKVTYGGLTKTIEDTSGAEIPNAVQVFFGTFNGVSDSVTTPDSGTLTIEGNFAAWGSGSYGSYANKTDNAHCNCIIGITEIGEFITNIPNYAFSNCTSLTSVTIPDSVTSIGNYAFNNCTSLTNISTLKCATIGNYAFYGCATIASILLAEGVVSIGMYAFQLGTESAITTMDGGSIVIPSTVQSIGVDAFVTTDSSSMEGYMSNYLDEVHFLSTTPPSLIPPIGQEDTTLCWDDIFGWSGGTVKIIVPLGCLDVYEALSGHGWPIEEAS